MGKIVGYIGIIMLSCLVFLVGARGQNYNLTKYSTTTSNLPSNYAYAIKQDGNGFLWIGTSDGLSRFDGVSFVNFTEKDSLADLYVSSLLIDGEGKVWSGHGNGQVSVWDGESFTKIHIDDVSAPIKSMCLDDRSNVWAIEQNKGLICISPSYEVRTYHDRKAFGRQSFNAIQAINAYNVLLGTSNGLLLVRLDVNGTLSNIETIPDIEYVSVEVIEPSRDGNNYWVGTEDGRVFKYNLQDGLKEVAKCAEVQPDGEVITAPIHVIYEEDDSKLLLGTWGRGITQWEYAESKKQYVETLALNTDNGLENNYISGMIVDREGIYWFATYGAGAVSWANNYFAQYKLSSIGYQKMKVTDIAVNGNDLWVGLNAGLIRMDRQCVSCFEYYSDANGLPNHQVTDIIIGADKTIYVGMEDMGVYMKKADSSKFQKIEYESPTNTTDMVNSMAINGNILYIATQGGFIAYSLTEEKSIVYTTNEGLPHNCINFVFVDNESQIWIGPKDSGIAMLESEKNTAKELPDDATWDIHRLSEEPINVPAMTQDSNSRKWLVSLNNGVLCATNDSVISITMADGLEKNFSYDIASDSQERIWVCHQPGLSCIDLQTGNIRTFNSSMGFDQEYTHAYTDEDGDIWFVSQGGILFYSAKRDKRNNVPPIINRTKTVIAGKSYSPSENIDLSYPYFRDLDKFEFSFVGICMRDPGNVKYEYWLQMGEEEEAKWASLGNQANKGFDFIPDGDYTLKVRAYNSDGVQSQNMLSIPIHIDKPFWKSFLFPIVVAVILFYLNRAIIKSRERRIKRREEELEREVQRQTHQLQRQKDIIERKNQDITDSINYANRIQTAILPSRMGLKEYDLADSFLMFRPKDIVSGDCYWHGQFGDHLLICCGDCTGHGVPGAFMSMIVTTILNDATRDEEIRRHPAKLLEIIDRDIKQTLNKNQVVEAQDGMDCAILDINLVTREMISAGARRPVIVFSKGKFVEIKGTRRSVGERRNGNEFLEETTQLYEGDIIYAFSDGYTDQFNPKDDKYTTGKLKRLLQEIYTLPMDEQQDILEKGFVEWMGSHEQMDDVIVMGIKLK